MKSSYWLFGKNACIAALLNPKRHILEVLVSKNLSDQFAKLPSHINVRVCSEVELAKVTAHGVHQGIAVKVSPLAQPSLEEVLNKPSQHSVLLLLDQITDPQNVGAILRSAAAFDVDGVILTEHSGISQGGALAKVASGALELVPLIKVVNLKNAIELLKANDYWVFGLEGTAPNTITCLGKYDKIALVLGSEGKGMRNLVSKNCDMLLRIPISQRVESLNVASACAIALFAAKAGKSA